MEKAKKITAILLKVVATGAIIIVSFFYCYNSGNNRYNMSQDDVLLDKKTGNIYYYSRGEEVLSGKWILLGSFPSQIKK